VRLSTKVLLALSVLVIVAVGAYYVFSGPGVTELQKKLNESKAKLDAVTLEKKNVEKIMKDREATLLKQLITIKQKVAGLEKERNEYAEKSKELEGMLASVTVASTAAGVVDELHALGYPGARVVKLPRQNR
jgi:hypothetical protein